MPQAQQTKHIADLEMIIQIQQEVVTSNLELQQLMDLICKRTQDLTCAAAAVVEIAEGPHMVYRACSGTATQSLGLKLNIDTSLSGLSVKTNEVLYCEDSENDPRVDREACRRVGARSMICVPLIYQKQPIGVLKVYTPDAKHFLDRDINVLRLTASLLSASIAQTRDTQALQENERKFRSLFQASYDPIMISKDGLIVDVNDAFTPLFGWTREEVKGKDVTMVVLASDREKVKTNLATNFEQSYEVTCIRKDNSTVLIHGVGKNIELGGEKYRMSTLRDITDQRHLENNLRESEAKAREATQIKSAFLANMSHEIRTPLNGVIGIANLLAGSELKPEQHRHLDMIRSSADTLLAIVNDILDFSKIEAKKLDLEKIDFELRPSVEDMQQIFHYAAQKKGLKLDVHFATDLPKHINGDPSRLRQILLNLIGNAVKFTAKGTVTVKVDQLSRKDKKSQLQFQIVDTGIGIPQNAMKNMFQAFTQADNSTTRKFGGTGLGLSICRQLVEMMGGEIGVDSIEGQGSTFWFRLTMPVAENVPRPPAEGFDMKNANNKKMRILIAEDNMVNQVIVKAMLEHDGHNLTVVANGQEALDALRLAPYDMVLMDCQMPEMDGFAATQHIRNSAKEPWSNIYVVAMTANAMAGDREKCLEAGMDDYVSKPLRNEDLSSAIYKAGKRQDTADSGA